MEVSLYDFWKYVVGEQWTEDELRRVEADPDWALFAAAGGREA